MILSVVLGHKGGYTRFTGEDTKAQGDEETAGPRRSQGLSGANGGGTALAGRSPARCALAAPHEEECPWHRTIREIIPHVLASENHVCPSCAKCQPRYLNYPIESSQQVGMYYPHFVDKKMEARRGLVHNRPPARAGAAGATRLAPSRPETANSRWFRSPPTLHAFSSPGAHRHLFYSAGCVTSPGLANSFCR